MRLLKIGSRTCPSCTANKRFDKDIAWQLGYDLVDIYKNTVDYDAIKSVREQFTGQGWKLAFPTYVFVDDELNILGSVSGVTTAGMFKAALQACLKKNATPKGEIDCTPVGEQCGAANFENWIILTGEDGHVVRYDKREDGSCHAFGADIEPLHRNTKYNYELFSTFADPGQPPGTGRILHRIVNDGRKLEMEESDDMDWADLTIEMAPGYGTFEWTSDTTGVLTVPETCGDFPGLGDNACSENGGTPDGCTPTTIFTEMNDQPRFYAHVWDRSKITSVAVLNVYDPQGHKLLIDFNRNVCDLPDIANSYCICSNKTAAGAGGETAYGEILEVLSVDVEQLSETTFEYFFYGTIQQEPGTEGSSSGINDKAFVPSCLQFFCCNNNGGGNGCEDGRPDGNIDIGDGDGDGLGDCDKRPTPEPVPGSNDRNPVYLYDRLNHTYIFCCPIKADVTWLLPFDTLPPVFQRYITAVASVRVSAQMINNPQLFQLLKDRENTLRMECMNYELEQGDLNFLNQPDHSTYLSYQTMQTLNR